MDGIKKTVRITTLILLPFIFSACFAVRIVENVKNPDRYFRKAYQQIERIHQNYPDREGRVHKINVLVYDSSDCEVIKVTAPFWIVNACMDIASSASEEDDFDFEDRYDFDWRDIKELRQIGPGLLIDIDDEESRVLIWID